EHNTESRCLDDPLYNGGVNIKNNRLTLSLQYFWSCGSWMLDMEDYTFRYQSNAFELINYFTDSFHRASGEEQQTDTNYLKKQQTITTELNIFDEEKSKPKKTIRTIEVLKMHKLHEITQASLYPDYADGENDE
ncbi:MAG: hypothetical protein KGV46_03580, partial [Pasteurella sp.]|nr:hypothetical protein [Pasteurella sp.]